MNWLKMKLIFRYFKSTFHFPTFHNKEDLLHSVGEAVIFTVEFTRLLALDISVTNLFTVTYFEDEICSHFKIGKQ